VIRTERDYDKRFVLSMAFTIGVYMYGSANTLIPYCMARRWYMAWCGVKKEHSMRELMLIPVLFPISNNEYLHGLLLV
jgi:hypothetical protein